MAPSLEPSSWPLLPRASSPLPAWQQHHSLIRRLTLNRRASTDFVKAKMNRFLTKKRAKKPTAEPKFELDLTTALPSTDNFRTSLLMPGLSTRFSMLREQDDPRSMLGKASDDSVLMPNRRSRLYDFGYNPSHLNDIAEVSSLVGDIKPGFGLGHRQDSFASADGYGYSYGYGTDDESTKSGSMMTRARPGEGNILFGGRQKIYKIAESGSTKGGMAGRAMYEDDVNVSAFQAYQKQERARRDQELQHGGHGTELSSPVKASSPPSLSGYNNRRETSSSTTSGQNARTSTAATSITSQGPNAIPPMSPGLPLPSYNGQSAQGLHPTKSSEQQSTTLHRLNSLQRSRNGATNLYSTQPKSTPNLQDRYQRAGFNRGASPPFPHPLSPVNPEMREFGSPEHSPHVLSDSAPISPISSEYGEHTILSASIDPNDRGKATALGAFSKPKPYTEAEFVQRQKLMQQGRSTPTQGRETPTLPREQPRGGKPMRSSPPMQPVGARSPSPLGSPDKSAFSIFQNAASQYSRHLEPPMLSPTGRNHPSSVDGDSDADRPSSSASPGHGQRYVKRTDLPSVVAPPPPPPNDHPAFRPGSPFEQPADGHHALTADEPRETTPPNTGLNPGTGLSSLVRQHMRTGSDRSSFYELAPTEPSPVRSNGAPTYSYGQGNLHANGMTSDYTNGLQPTPENEAVPWQDRLKPEHARDISVETTASHGAFANELAERQRAIQEKLKNKVENELRSTSPTPTKTSNGFKTILRPKTSRDSIADQRSESKGRKTLVSSSSFSNLSSIGRRSEEEKRARGKYGVPIPPDPEDSVSPYDSRGSRDRSLSRSTKGKSPPASARSSGLTTRNRSDSDLSGGRSRSRSGRYKDDLDRAMADGTSSRITSMYPESVYSTADVLEEHPMPTPPVPQIQSSVYGAAAATRLRSNSNASSPSSATIPQNPWEPQQPQQNGLHPAMRQPSAKGKIPANTMGMHTLNTAQPNYSSSARPSPSSAGVSPAFSPAGRSPIINQTGTSPPVTFNPLHSSIVGALPPSQQMPNGMPAGPNGSIRGAQSRKRSVNKHEISEPTLISTTSVVETVNLPPGASLRNGMGLNYADSHHQYEGSGAPLVPPVNPRRKIFGFGRSGDSSPADQRSFSPPPSGGPVSGFDNDTNGSGFGLRGRSRSQPRGAIKKSAGAGSPPQQQQAQQQQQREVLHHAVGSPPIVMTEGGMF